MRIMPHLVVGGHLRIDNTGAGLLNYSATMTRRELYDVSNESLS